MEGGGGCRSEMEVEEECLWRNLGGEGEGEDLNM